MPDTTLSDFSKYREEMRGLSYDINLLIDELKTEGNEEQFDALVRQIKSLREERRQLSEKWKKNHADNAGLPNL